MQVIPRLCKALYDQIMERTTEDRTYTVEVSYFEIYKEKVKDLLSADKHPDHDLKVRNHKVFGPYVEGLQKLAARGYDDVKMLMDKGTCP